MGLDPNRKYRVTASQMPVLVSGDERKILNMFYGCIGDERFDPGDFAGSWPARYGALVEGLALDWHVEQTGADLAERGVQYYHPDRPYVSATLDARRRDDNCVLDVKCVNAYRDLREVCAWYTPQLLCQKECAKADKAALLVVCGGNEPVELEIFLTEDYAQQVWQVVEQFWHCVETLTPPFDLPTPIAPEKWRTVDLDRDQPNWGNEMAVLLAAHEAHEPQARNFEAIKVAIKKLLPDDVGRVICGPWLIRRARNNAITITTSTK